MKFLKNFIKSLLDIKFENYIALKVLGILLVIVYIFDTFLIISLYLSFDNTLIALLFFIVFYPISLIAIRVYFEAFSALIKIAENTSKINKKLDTLRTSEENAKI